MPREFSLRREGMVGAIAALLSIGVTVAVFLMVTGGGGPNSLEILAISLLVAGGVAPIAAVKIYEQVVDGDVYDDFEVLLYSVIGLTIALVAIALVPTSLLLEAVFYPVSFFEGGVVAGFIFIVSIPVVVPTIGTLVYIWLEGR